MNRNIDLDGNIGHRIAILIDVENVYKIAKRFRDSRLNYEKFLKWVAGEYSVTIATAYVLMDPGNIENEKKFLSALRLSGYDIRTKPAWFKKSNLDEEKVPRNDWVLGISLDAITLSHKVDTIAIVSSNRNFVETCYYLKNKVRIEIISIKDAIDPVLLKACTEFNEINEECFDPFNRED